MLNTVPAFLFIALISILCFPALSLSCPKISTSEAAQQMDSLATDIRYHNRLYYEKARPVISDAEYDRLFASLVELEKCFPEQAVADSPTRTVGSGGDATIRAVKHVQPMLSLSSTTGPEAVETLLKRVAADGNGQLLVQPKVDGLPVELLYSGGQLVSAATRGDGWYGEDVTERARAIKGVPRQLTGAFPEQVVVRGEVYADLSLLRMYRAGKNFATYATPRHAAAALLREQNPDPAAVALLRLFPYELVRARSLLERIRSDNDALMLLAAWGFPVNRAQSCTVRSFSEIQASYRAYLADREQQPFAMDGIVVKVADLAARQRLGNGERAPLWAAAWKFPPDSAKTQILRINRTVGRTGRRTPVATVVPVRLGDVLVSHVSLHNEAEITRLDIEVGDQVVLALVGDVIPQLVEVVERTGRAQKTGAVLPAAAKQSLNMCLSDTPVCRDQYVARATYFVSKRGLNIAGLGRKRVHKLVEAGLFTDLPSLFTLSAEQIATVPGFGVKPARRLIAEIRAASRADSFHFVTALGIPGVGPKSVEHLPCTFISLDALLAAKPQQLSALSATDARTVRTIRQFFKLPGGKDMLKKFRENGVLNR
ncbi:MAG: NAD-dependent DNA ligase LigA [Desulfuromonadaceae bacterium]|nr:NAD-dependent DNA ligase LigA [Desulfuromonadaceae bacterium]MDD5105207.1 NAD-dependent DNA ligase LigA [Desulfuromonadaceae bacterium]